MPTSAEVALLTVALLTDSMRQLTRFEGHPAAGHCNNIFGTNAAGLSRGRSKQVLPIPLRESRAGPRRINGVVISYRHKGAIRGVGKTLGVSLETVDAIAKGHVWWDGKFERPRSPHGPDPRPVRAGRRQPERLPTSGRRHLQLVGCTRARSCGPSKPAAARHAVPSAILSLSHRRIQP